MKVARPLALLLLLASACALAQSLPAKPRVHQSTLELAPPSSPLVQRWTIASTREPALTQTAKLRLLRERIKYVFVLFQENRSFDFYFATYPAADGLYAQAPNNVAGFTQPIVNTDGTISPISPFKIPFSVTDVNGRTVPLYPSDIASVNHSHTGIAAKLDLDASLIARNDRYALTEEGVTLDAGGKPNKAPSLERKQFGELVLAHIDCDAAPFLWQYADRFTLFDHFMDTVIGPSTPNAIAMIAGQSGETQWMLHPELADPTGARSNQLPIVADPVPYWGLLLDAKGDHPRQPNPAPKSKATASKKPDPRLAPAPNLTFAALPLSFMGNNVEKTVTADYDPTVDLADVQADIKKIAGHGVAATNWGWYQQGYDHESTDPTNGATHSGYIVHHNAPQYFGYIANNPDVNTHLHGLGDFFADVAARRLPNSGVFYVRGGYGNLFDAKPLDPNPDLATVFNGDDDHPGYSDSQISESLLAREINAIASSPYWSQSVILIAYDESDGLYDHVRPRVRSHDAAGLPLDQGPRIPAVLISPYAVAHGVSHQPAEHSSIIKLVDELFNLIPLADLPDEERARAIGVAKFGQRDLGPADDKVAGVGDLLSGFSNARLLGRAAPLPSDYAEIPAAEIDAYPHYNAQGCSLLQIRPTDTGRSNPIPADFNPRPDTTPGIPTSGHWTP